MKDKKNNNRILPLLLSVLAVILVLGFCLSASGASITLKVGFYPLEGFFELDSDNNPSGYGVEYLEKVSEYSGIQFQYVPSETWENLGCMMRSSEIDIMMPVQDTIIRPEEYIYSTDNIMHSFFALMTTKNRDDLYFEDYEKFSDLKIAVDKYTMEDENLEEYITSHGLEKNLKVYGGYDLCLGAVKKGEADALISNVMDMTDELKILDKFGITRNYIIMRRDDSRFAALDKAISKIKVNEPYFDANIYGKFFPQRAFLPFTKEETQLIESKAPLTVAVYSDKKPIVYFDSEKRKFEGIAVDMLRLVGEKTGLTFNFIGIAANENPQSSFDEKSADFCITVDEAQYCGNGIEISISQPLFMSPMDFVGKAGKELSREEHLNIAVSDKTQNIESIIHRSFKDASIIEFTGAEAAFAAVRSGDADLYAGSKFIANYQRLNPANSQLSSMPFISSPQSYSVASGKPNSEMLVSIIDKGLLRIGEDEKNSTIYHHSVTDKYAMTMGDIIYKYRYVWLLLAILLLGLIKFAMLKAQYYKKLKIKTIEAENANEAKSDFLSRVSHDMRTPMNAIIGFSQIAMTEDISLEEMRGFMVKINSSGKYMLGLINDVLDMAKIEKKKMVLQKAPVDGEKFIRDIDSIIRPQMDERAVNFYIELINIDTKKSAVIDEMRVKQIFINLLNNAAKFTPKGGRVDCIFECVEMKGDTAKYKVLVRDTGIGMPEDFLPLLFTPFVQGSNSDIQKGTGLGLSIVKALVDLIGGTISVESKEGSGTTFTVEFSAQLVEKSDQEEKPNTDISKLSGAKILLCEDHPLNAQIAEKLLSHVGARTEIATNGEEGVNMFKASPMGYFDIILMDIRMPVLNGFKATEKIRELDRSDAASVPIIAMTANAFDDDKKAALDCGMDAHMTKPIDPAILYATLAEFLNKSPNGRTLATSPSPYNKEENHEPI